MRELAEDAAAARDRANRLQAQLDMEHATKLGRAVVVIRRAVLRVLPVGSQRRAVVAKIAAPGATAPTREPGTQLGGRDGSEGRSALGLHRYSVLWPRGRHVAVSSLVLRFA